MTGNTPPNPNQNNGPQDNFDEDLANAHNAEMNYDQATVDQVRSDMRQAALNDPDYFKAARKSYQDSVEQGDPGDRHIEAALRPPMPEIGTRTNEKVYTDKEMMELRKELMKTPEGAGFEQTLSKVRALGPNANPTIVAGLTKRLDLYITGTKNDPDYGKDGPKFNKNFQLNGDPRRAAIVLHELRKARQDAANWQPPAARHPLSDPLLSERRRIRRTMGQYDDRLPTEDMTKWKKALTRQQQLRDNDAQRANGQDRNYRRRNPAEWMRKRGYMPSNERDHKEYGARRETMPDGSVIVHDAQVRLERSRMQKIAPYLGFSDAARARWATDQEQYDKLQKAREDNDRAIATRNIASAMAGDMPTIKADQIQGMEQVIGGMEYFQQNPTPESEAADVNALRDRIDDTLRQFYDSSFTDIDAEHEVFRLLQQANNVTTRLNARINKLGADDPMRGELRMVADRMMTAQLTRVGHYAQLRIMRHDTAGLKPDTDPARDGAQLPSYTRDGGVELKDGSGVVIYADSYAVMQPNGTPGRRMFITDTANNDWDPAIAHDSDQVDPYRPNHLDIQPSEGHDYTDILDDMRNGNLSPSELHQMFEDNYARWFKDQRGGSTADLWNVAVAYNVFIEGELEKGRTGGTYTQDQLDQIQITANRVNHAMNWSFHNPGEWNQSNDPDAPVNMPNGTVLEADREYYGLRGAWCVHPNGVRELIQVTSTGPSGKPVVQRRFDPTGREVPVI